MDKTKKYIKDFYNKNATKWTSKKFHSFYHETPFRKFEKLLKPGGQVIDIGCANGIHVPLFLGIGRKLKYTGIDISKSMIEMALSRYPQLSFSVDDIETYSPKKKFDGFWSAATLMHIPEEKIDATLNNIKKFMKPGSIGYLTLPTQRPNPKHDADQRHFSLYTKESFKKLIRKHDWKILSSGTLTAPEGTSNWNWFLVKLP